MSGLTGDQIIEADGKAIADAPAREMSGQLKNIKPGEHRRLKVKRKDASVAMIDIVAGP